ncbi:uncharacterized protein B0H18DRAFT_925397 [Fomitopsis serialis]|uniref:uncharacterized protein n=1 Tax=Fomitopsis serialis TaxID=139415 RepID=UPI0020085BA3|nr:uncharacterized protein B0H18DRAFT_925397 [Neoantrodia serialis]KAH9937097.1 hypothetical protein B0H18DRAFT_925397 [Neoantrodia serialis]
MAIASGDPRGVKHLIMQGLKERVSTNELIKRVDESIEGFYHARGYTAFDFDLALLILRLGGRKLLYAMNQCLAIPSIRALRRARRFTRLMPSFGRPTISEVRWNLSEVLGPKIQQLKDAIHHATNPPSSSAGPDAASRKLYGRTGISVCWDEISQEEVACYFPHADSVGGLCREHCGRVDLRLRSFQSAVNIAEDLDKGKVHFGKEVSVLAVASFGEDLRGAFPVAVSPTCKSETPEEGAEILRTVFAAWKDDPDLTEYLGPLWTFASDGDAGRRAMVYSMLMAKKIDLSHPLYKIVGHLPGLNLNVGDDDITADFDWKHEIKRLGRLMRTQDGIVIGDTIVNCHTMTRHLSRIPQLSAVAVDRLMNPSDSQDVPRAIDLLRAISSLSALPLDDYTPTELQEHRAITIVGEMLSAFVDAFISPEWSLTQQVVSLSKYAHMIFALYRQHQASFMPHQLYGDTQTTVKNVIFCIAKQQLLDGNQRFYLYDTGDDKLEELFGNVRMQGGHNPNFSFKQLVDRLGAAIDIDAVFTAHPELHQGSRRRKVTRTEHADHLNHASWTGDTVVDNVNLRSAWAEGRKAATNSLSKLCIAPGFDVLFRSSSSSIDMLQPIRPGKFPGVSMEQDRSLDSEAPAPANSPATRTTSTGTAPGESESEPDSSSSNHVAPGCNTRTSSSASLQGESSSAGGVINNSESELGELVM